MNCLPNPVRSYMRHGRNTVSVHWHICVLFVLLAGAALGFVGGGMETFRSGNRPGALSSDTAAKPQHPVMRDVLRAVFVSERKDNAKPAWSGPDGLSPQVLPHFPFAISFVLNVVSVNDVFSGRPTAKGFMPRAPPVSG